MLSALEGFGNVPMIRPLETLHNALSLKKLDTFLEKVTNSTSPTKCPSAYTSDMEGIMEHWIAGEVLTIQQIK